MGPIYSDADALLAEAGTPLITVGDMVTYHVLSAGRVPDVALIDDRTERSAVDPTVADAIEGFDRCLTATNPPGTITKALLDALSSALAGDSTTLIEVGGEEDLAALPAVLGASEHASIVYGQPGEGMVLVSPDTQTRKRVRSILDQMNGNTDRIDTAFGNW
jgi:uncharacterized protein (UPF0218 family)